MTYTTRCKAECKNTHRCGLKTSAYADRCPCNDCLVRTMCTNNCSPYNQFRVFINKVNETYERYELYIEQKKQESRF